MHKVSISRLMAPLPERAARLRRRGLLALFAVALAAAMVMQNLGWAQTSHYALVRALGSGTAQIDAYHWETKDKAYTDGHFYSVKAPGLALSVLPAYATLDAMGAQGAGRDIALASRESTALGGRWYRRFIAPENYGGSRSLAIAEKRQIEFSTLMVWALGLVGVVLPALVMLILVRSLAERVAPGYGTAAAVTLGACTLIFPFSTLFFSHVPAAMLGFAAFALLWREREGPQRLWLVAGAGALAGLAVTYEYPMALAGAIVGLYGLARAGPRARRALAYAGGVFAGLVPLLVYNALAFGTPFHSSYDNAVKELGATGHDVLGLNEEGFFGIGLPSGHDALELLFAPRGLLVLTPVVALAVVGLVLMRRTGRRAETYTIAAIALGYLAYNAGYWLPFGGGSAGPRFLIPMLPFLAVPLAMAWRRLPVVTLALAAPSAFMMLAATLGHPMIGDDNIGFWVQVADFHNFEHTVFTMLGAGNGYRAAAPVLLALLIAFALAASVMPRQPVLIRQRLLAFATLAGWTAVAVFAPALVSDDTALTNDYTLRLILTAAAVSLALLVAFELGRLLPRLVRVLSGDTPRTRSQAARATAGR